MATGASEGAAAAGERNAGTVDTNGGEDSQCSILLFYQYIEPAWSDKEHKVALRKLIEICERHEITGRGRVATEGFNCTLTGTGKGIQSLCRDLRLWNRVFEETDFKVTNHVDPSKRFKSLSIRKTNELVAYGLEHDKAPSLAKFGGVHLDAEDYHKAMEQEDTVVIDVRNAYETAIGNFQPPRGAAQLVDPQLRNSIEFPKWLASQDTQAKLHNKTVLMYCTGGIRCERATALLNQMSTAAPNTCKPKAVYELKGGIERYLKAFPEGGYWKGKNYLFDRRMEQLPPEKSLHDVERELAHTDTAKCCLCEKGWTVYRGQFECSKCHVPVIVCKACNRPAAADPSRLNCQLCRTGYRGPPSMASSKLDLREQKRKAEQIYSDDSPKKARTNDLPPTSTKTLDDTYDDRLFVSRLPLTVTATTLKEAVSRDIVCVQWLVDRQTGAFYGSCIVQFQTPRALHTVLNRGNVALPGHRKKIRLSKVKKMADNAIFPPPNYTPCEYPPIGTAS